MELSYLSTRPSCVFFSQLNKGSVREFGGERGGFVRYVPHVNSLKDPKLWDRIILVAIESRLCGFAVGLNQIRV